MTTTKEEFANLVSAGRTEEARKILSQLVTAEKKEKARELFSHSLEQVSCRKEIESWQDDKKMSALIRSIFCK